MADLLTKLEVYQEFLDCSSIPLWHYDGEMRLISTNAPNPEALETSFLQAAVKSRFSNTV